MYGDQPVLPYDEAGPLSAVYPYDASKLCAETLARGYAATYALPVGDRAVREHLRRRRPELVAHRARDDSGDARRRPPVVRSDGTLERDYMYVSDAVNAYLTLAANVGREDVRGEAFNFGWGRGFSALEIVQAILRHAGSRIEPRILGENHGEIQRQWLSSEKAARVLGWQPAVVLDEGIDRSVAVVPGVSRRAGGRAAGRRCGWRQARMRNEEMSVVILCGGLGTRAYPYTQDDAEGAHAGG